MNKFHSSAFFKHYLGIFCAFILGLNACKQAPTRLGGSRSSDAFDYLDTKFKLEYSNGPEELNGKVKLRVKKDSLIWASITGPLGAEGIRAKVVQDSIYMIDRISKTYMEANLDTLKHILNFEVDFQMLQSILLGNMPFPELAGDEKITDGKLLKITQDRQNILLENYLNPKTQKLEKLIVQDKRNKNSLQVAFKDFKKLGNLLFPMRSDIKVKYFNPNTNTMEEANIAVNHSKTFIPEENLSFPFNVPPKYEKIQGSK
ncbi:MAG: DUF4292 domain-containing protein [Microscillaceae bacterium]|nr:DUF4292 domain-containing protein [Microscillaceae bacterium]